MIQNNPHEPISEALRIGEVIRWLDGELGIKPREVTRWAQKGVITRIRIPDGSKGYFSKTEILQKIVQPFRNVRSTCADAGTPPAIIQPNRPH